MKKLLMVLGVALILIGDIAQAGAKGPDFIIRSDMMVSHERVGGTGYEIIVGGFIKNTGTVPGYTKNFSITIIGEDGIGLTRNLEGVINANLAPGEITAFTVRMPIQQWLDKEYLRVGGRYRVIGHVDMLSMVRERNENNNRVMTWWQFGRGSQVLRKPSLDVRRDVYRINSDLVPTKLVTRLIRDRETGLYTMLVAASIKNVGTEPSKVGRMKTLIRGNKGMRLATENRDYIREVIDPMQVLDVQFGVPVQRWMDGRALSMGERYKVEFFVDSSNTVRETNENNNVQRGWWNCAFSRAR